MAKVSSYDVERVFYFKPKGLAILPDGGNFSQQEWKSLSDNSLTLIRGMHLIHYASEYPIVRYQPRNHYEDDAKLNGIIRSITVSTGIDGRCTSVHNSEIIPKYETVFYYEDNFGVYHSIINDELCQFLLQKPNFLVSPEGVLIFYTDQEIIATIDCHQCYSLNELITNNNVFRKSGKIHSITIADTFCKICLFNSRFAQNMLFSLNINLRENSISVAHQRSFPVHRS